MTDGAEATVGTERSAGEPIEPAQPVRRAPIAVVAGAWALLALPLLVALLEQHRTRWFPIADLAQTELRLRDVGGSHTPLMGLAGRIGPFTDAGSHPGPISFWLMAPVYRLLGSTAFAFQAAATSLHLVAFALALWLAVRRGGAALVVGVAAGLAVLERSYGSLVFFEGWNPYLPVSWWVVVLLGAWSVLDDDLAALPVLVLAGSVCAQTHLPYVGLVGGLVGLLVLAAGVWWWRTRPASAEERGRRLRWVGGSTVLGLVLWAPPLVEQVTGTGNLGKVVDTLRHPDEPPTGLGAGLRALARNLDPVALLTGRLDITRGTSSGSVLAGVLLVVVWLAAVAAAVVLGHRRLLRWHAVAAAALALGALSATRVTGALWFYLFLWARGLAVVLLLATAATAVVALRRRVPSAHRATNLAPLGLALVVLLGSVGAATFDATDGERSQPGLTADLGVLSAATADALDAGVGPATGHDGRYLVVWSDPDTLGAQGFGLVNELERRGFDVGVEAAFGPGAVRHRVLDPERTTAVVHLVLGPAIGPYVAAHPDAIRVATVDRRTDAERAESDRLVAHVDRELRAAGLDAVAQEWATNRFTATLRPEVPADLVPDMSRVIDLGARTDVYLEPPSPT